MGEVQSAVWAELTRTGQGKVLERQPKVVVRVVELLQLQASRYEHLNTVEEYHRQLFIDRS